MRSGEVDVEQVDLREDVLAAKIQNSRQASTNQLCVSVIDLLDALVRERLLPGTVLDVVQDAHVGRIRLVQEVLECKVRLTKPVTEVLREDSATFCASSSVLQYASPTTRHVIYVHACVVSCTA